MPIHVLIYPCSEGIGQEIYFALRDRKDVNVYGCNAGQLNTGRFLYKRYIGNAPDLCKPDFIEYIKHIIHTYEIDAIFPASDHAQLHFKQHESTYQPSRIISSPLHTVMHCIDRNKLYAHLSNIIRVPKVYDYNETPEYPIFIKRILSIHKNPETFLVNSRNELEALSINNDNYMLTEYMPNDEFVVDCLTDVHGRLQFCAGRKRAITRAGISIITETVDHSQFQAFANKINDHLTFIGAWFFQCKYDDDGVLCLIDVAPRIAGSMALYRNLGVNFPLLTLYIHFDKPIEILWMNLHAKCAKIYHNYLECPAIEYDNVCVDLDETLILADGRVNHRLMGFLYKSLNENKKLYLITRHRGDVTNTLISHRIPPGLFNTIIHISNERCNKGDYIPPRSIFIDDSFRERKRVKNSYPNVYVFDVDALDMLVNACPPPYNQ